MKPLPVILGSRGALAVAVAAILVLALLPAGCSKKSSSARPAGSVADETSPNAESFHGEGPFVLPADRQTRWTYSAMPDPAPSKKPAYLLRSVAFPTGGTALDREGQAVFRELGAMLEERAQVRVLIVGLADGHGEATNATNTALARAHAARDHLVKQGVARDRCEVAGFGSSQAQAGKDEPLAQQQDRRVEVWLIEE